MANAGAASASITGRAMPPLKASNVTRRISLRINQVVLCIKTPTIRKWLLIQVKKASMRAYREIQTFAILLGHDLKRDFVLITETLVNAVDLSFSNPIVNGLLGGLGHLG